MLGTDHEGLRTVVEQFNGPEADTLQVEKLDGLSNVPRYYGFGIVGLEREALLKGLSLDDYISLITKKISSSDLPSELLTRISKSITPITYHGMTVLMIEVQCGSEPVYYKDIRITSYNVCYTKLLRVRYHIELQSSKQSCHDK